MASSSAGTPKTRSLAEFDREISSSAEPEKLLLDNIIAVAKIKNPELAAAIRYCAVPRSLTAELVGVLRNAVEEGESNSALLQELIAYNLVTRRRGGGYAYQDSMRNLLLDYWRENPERRITFDELNRRLETYFLGEHEQTRKLEQDLLRTAKVVQAANSERYVQFTSAVEGRALAALKEAIYHACLISAQEGYDAMTDAVKGYEVAGRLTLALSLVEETQSCLASLPSGSGQEAYLNWLSYWRGRIRRKLTQYAEAEVTLRDLLPKVGTDKKLEVSTLGELGSTLYDQEKFREARDYYEKELAESSELPEYRPLPYAHLGTLHWTMDELDKAADYYRKSIEAAKQASVYEQQASSLLKLSGVTQNMGKWPEALEAALTALDLVNVELSEACSLRQAVNERLSLLGRDPRLLDTLYRELEGIHAGADRALLLRQRSWYADLLRAGGQLARADAELLQIAPEAEGDTALENELLFRRAAVYEDEGRIQEAIAICEQIIARTRNGQGGAWHLGFALLKRSEDYCVCTRLAEAKADAIQAQETWRALGNQHLEALALVCSANASRKQGDLDTAERLLTEARQGMMKGPSRYAHYYHRAWGDLYKARADWAAARREYETALGISSQLEQFTEAASNYVALINLTVAAGDWDQAADWVRHAGVLFDELARNNAYRPTEDRKNADELNARGKQCLCLTGSERRKSLIKGRDWFRAAVDCVPDKFWYCLNLAYTCAELGDYLEATGALKTALENGPDWADSPVFKDRLLVFSNLAYRRLQP